MQENERREKTVPAEFMAGTKDYADFTLTHVIVSSSSLKRRQGERRPDPGSAVPKSEQANGQHKKKHTRRFPYKSRPEMRKASPCTLHGRRRAGSVFRIGGFFAILPRQGLCRFRGSLLRGNGFTACIRIPSSGPRPRIRSLCRRRECRRAGSASPCPSSTPG